MTAFDPIAALALPAGAHVDRRVPKTLLIENGAATATDKRRIRDGVEEIRWLAVLKPTTVGVAAYRDAVREYLEVAVLTLTLRPNVRTERLTELAHRAVPYPVLLYTGQGEAVGVSLAHKRWSQVEAGRTVLDGGIISAALGSGAADGVTDAFMCALALRSQPRATLHALYQGWIDAVQALNAARVTGEFAMPTSAAVAARRATAIDEYRSVDAQIAKLLAEARRDRQLPRRVAMNLEVTLLESIEHVKRGRSEDDILYELLLKLGLDLCVPIETRMMAGKTVRSVGAGTLIACLAERITSDEIEPLGLGIAEWHAELEPAGDTTVVFCDSAFADDVAKDDKVRSELSGAGLHHREEAATRPVQLSVDADRQGHHPVRTRSVKMAGIQGKEAGRWLTLLDGTRLWRTGGSPTTWKLTDACSSSRTSLHGSTSKPERTTSHRRQWSECTGSYANSQAQSVPSRRRCTSLYDQVGAVYCAPSRTCRACHLGVVMTGG